jgi:hypothetical protein
VPNISLEIPRCLPSSFYFSLLFKKKENQGEKEKKEMRSCRVQLAAF